MLHLGFVVLCGMGEDPTSIEVKNMRTGNQEVVQTYSEVRSIVVSTKLSTSL